MSIRDRVQHAIDALQFRFDVFPALVYQPLPWLGLKKAKRGIGTEARWGAIEAALRDEVIDSAVDIGCNTGYFCFSLAAKGIPTLGVERDDRFLRIAQYAANKMRAHSVGFCKMDLTPDTIRLLPQADLVLLLSVWHHWVRSYGLEAASEMLTEVWQKSQKVLFFETGEVEMSADFGLAMLRASPRQWLEDFLYAMCAEAHVTWLGTFKAFAPQGNETQKVVYRNLFKITRQDEGPLAFVDDDASMPSSLIEVRR
jgi:SAM-dependent methyltransferase